jgi:lipopolysaccharide heptosyltransferase II
VLKTPAGPLLVRLPNWLGDLVLALPVLEAVANDPLAQPALFVAPAAFRPLLGPRFPGVTLFGWSRSARYALVGAIRRVRPGRALLLTDSFSSALLAFWAGIPQRIGHSCDGRGPLLTRRVPRSGAPRSAPRSVEYAALAEAAGIRVADPTPRLRALEPEREAARALRDRSGAAGAYAVLAPGASFGPAKRWAPVRFAAVARHLYDRHGLRAILVGGSEDFPAAHAVLEAAGACVADLVGRTDLPTLVGLLEGADAVLSNDSGVMHLASALGRPTVGVFGSTSPVWTSVSAPHVRNLYASYPCSPCFRRTCPIGYGCLEAIDAGRAVRALEELLSAAGPAVKRSA